MNTANFIFLVKTKDTYKDIAKDVEKRFEKKFELKRIAF